MNKLELIWKYQIKNFEQDYLKISEYSTMPNYNIKFIVKNPTIDYNMKIINSTNPITLCIRDSIMMDNHYKENLVHEFTHICDFTFLLNDWEIKDKRKVLSLWSEYHATFLQSLYMIGIEDIKNIDISTLDFSILQKNLLIFIDNIKTYIDCFKWTQNIKYWHNMQICYMYYFGALKALNLFSPHKFSIIPFDFITDKLMENLYQILDKFNTNQSSFIEILKIRNELDKILITYAKEHFWN